MNSEQAVTALLGLIARHREQEWSARWEQAQAEVRAILREAHAAARKEVREALSEARTRIRARVALAEAQASNRQRRARQRRLKMALDECWGALRREVTRRWEEPGGRRRWIDPCIKQAAAVLPHGGWEIRHSPGWPADERMELERRLVAMGIGAPRFRDDAAIAAGLRIDAGDNTLDATLEGLLADRASIEARLLYHIETTNLEGVGP